MSRSIPEPAPVEDRLTGALIRAGAQTALATAFASGMDAVASGDFIVRYAIHYQGKSHLSIVPGLVVLDYGDMLTGEAAMSFLIERSNLHPRAEVAGVRDDGSEDMVFVRQLDLARPLEVLVYADAPARVPIARPSALIGPDGDAFPLRLRNALPLFPTTAAWQSETQP